MKKIPDSWVPKPENPGVLETKYHWKILEILNQSLGFIAKIDERERFSRPYVTKMERDKYDPVLIVIPCGRRFANVAKDADDAMGLSFEQTEYGSSEYGKGNWPPVSPAAKALFRIKREAERLWEEASGAWAARKETPPWVPTIVLDSDEEVAVANAREAGRDLQKTQQDIRRAREELRMEAVRACRAIARASHDSELELLRRTRAYRNATRKLTDRMCGAV